MPASLRKILIRHASEDDVDQQARADIESSEEGTAYYEIERLSIPNRFDGRGLRELACMRVSDRSV